MWIGSQLGFFSIVSQEGAWHVRARLKRDLLDLLQAARLDLPVQEWPGTARRFTAEERCLANKVMSLCALRFDGNSWALVEPVNWFGRSARKAEFRTK